MFIDFTGVIFAFIGVTVLPLIVGAVLRARGQRLGARIAAVVTIVAVFGIEALLEGPGSALIFTGVPLVLAVALYFASRGPAADG